MVTVPELRDLVVEPQPVAVAAVVVVAGVVPAAVALV